MKKHCEKYNKIIFKNVGLTFLKQEMTKYCPPNQLLTELVEYITTNSYEHLANVGSGQNIHNRQLCLQKNSSSSNNTAISVEPFMLKVLFEDTFEIFIFDDTVGKR